MKSSQGQHYSTYDRKENIYATCGEHHIVERGASVLKGGVKTALCGEVIQTKGQCSAWGLALCYTWTKPAWKLQAW